MIPVWFQRWNIRVELPEPRDPPDLPAIAARRGEALDRALGDVLARHGLPPEALVVVRRLSNRLILEDEPDEDAIAAGFARGVALAVDRALRERSTPDQLRVYPSRTAAERAWLWDRATGGGSSWWSPLVFEGGVVPAPAALLVRHLERAPQETLRLLVQVGAGLPRLLTSADAQEVALAVDQLVRARHEDLLPAHAARAIVLAGPVLPDEPPGTALLPPPHRALVRAAVLATRPQAPGWPDLEVRQTLAAGEPVVSRGPQRNGSERSAAVAPNPPKWSSEGDRLGGRADVSPAPSAASEGAPAEVHATAVPVASPGAEPGADEPEVAGGDSRSLPEASPRSASQAAEPPSAREAGAGERGPAGFDPFLIALDARDRAASPTTWHRVRCGGLLFLLRPALRGPWGDEPAALSERLWALGRAALDRLLQPLPPAQRRAALEREVVLLEALSGLQLDDPASTRPDPVRAREAAAELDRIVALLPEGVEAPIEDQRPLYGSHAALLADDLDGALAWLVLRPADVRLRGDEVLLRLPLRTVDLPLRRAGLDLDPGWVPWIGRVIRFEYVS